MKYQKSQIVHKLENYEQFPILGSLGIASNNSTYLQIIILLPMIAIIFFFFLEFVGALHDLSMIQLPSQKSNKWLIKYCLLLIASLAVGITGFKLAHTHTAIRSPAAQQNNLNPNQTPDCYSNFFHISFSILK